VKLEERDQIPDETCELGRRVKRKDTKGMNAMREAVE
jgi:predicted NAD-dependent protein-ADP-ribosyltransferase YbiA (DUF1768 family)